MTEQPYLDLLKQVLYHGVESSDRTGTGTFSVFAPQMRFDLSAGFPLLTTKRVPMRLVVSELLWFLQGRTDKQWLVDRNNHIWDEWSATSHPGFIGPGYGWQWRCFGAEYDAEYAAGWSRSERGVDQIADVIESLKTDPYGRRHIVSAWNPEFLGEMALPPCHTFFQFYVRDGKLSVQLYQRSADMFLGVPFNIASYALLTHIIAKEVGLEVGEFIWTGGDTHIYRNHVTQAHMQLARSARQLPTLEIADAPRLAGDILPNYDTEHFTVVGYEPHGTIKADVSV